MRLRSNTNIRLPRNNSTRLPSSNSSSTSLHRRSSNSTRLRRRLLRISMAPCPSICGPHQSRRKPPLRTPRSLRPLRRIPRDKMTAHTQRRSSSISNSNSNSSKPQSLTQLALLPP
jgi:hypothetical protein